MFNQIAFYFFVVVVPVMVFICIIFRLFRIKNETPNPPGGLTPDEIEERKKW